MTLAHGTKLGPYEIQSPLGVGGMGEVYRARDTRLDRTVAVKILPAHLSADPARKLRFEREAKAVSALNHPNICSLFDVGSQDGIDFLVMECIEGETLAQRLAKGALPIEQVLKIGTEIADALDKAHRCGVVHRDLKPGNIMVTKTGAKLLDFGLAKTAVSPAISVTLSGSSPVTEQGTLVGTFHYMSPEQVEGKELDGRSDIFSFGAVLYEMLTGQRAFQGKSQLSVASAILEKEPAPISSIKPLTPRSLDHVVRRSLAKDPDDRWQSARDLALELQSISQLDSAPASGTAVAGFASRSRRELIAWAIAAFALLAMLAFWFLSPKSEISAPPTYSSIIPPAGASFQIEGDQGAPPAVAPDGSAVVFGAGDDLWYRSLRGGTERVLPGTHGATFPFWSFDSSSIGFFADAKLKTLDISAGVVRSLCDAPSARGGSWGASGIILLSPAVRDVIYQIPASGGSPTAVTHLDPKLHTTHRWPFFLPDGQHFLYLATNHSYPQAEQNGVYLASLDGKVNRLLVSSLAGAAYAQGNLLYVNQSILYAQPLDLKKQVLTGVPVPLVEGVVVDLGVWHATFSVSQTNELTYQTGSASAQSRLEWVDRQGKHLSFVSNKGSIFGPRFSRDGRRLLVASGDPSADLWVFDASSPNKTRVTFDGAVVSEAVWSPGDSRFAVSIGLPKNRFDLITKPSSGSGPTTVLQEADDNDSPTDWSPDGRYLLTERFLHGGSEIWLHPLTPGEATRPLLTSSTTQGLQSSGQFSPDGKFVAFTLSTNVGPQVLVVPFPSGNGMWQVSVDGGRWPRWRRDGKELYFVSPRNVLTAVDIREKGDSLEVGHPVPLFPFHPSLRTYRQGMIDYDTSLDGKRFLLNAVADENTRPLTLVVNFTAGLKKK
ncbi:MAG TPA: protein kinase [Terriglobales bacterium]|nr:protein kinase [Terriglobales bacterium]